MAKMFGEFFDEGMEGFIINTARREYWRVAGLCDLDDLIQDGYLCYCKCAKRYGDPRNRDVPGEMTKSWMQALVGRAFMNHIFTLARKKEHGFAQSASEVVLGDETPEELLDRCSPAQEETGSFRVLLAQAPREFLSLLKLLAGDGKEALSFQRAGRRRETTNEYYCRLLGLNPAERDLVGELRAYFD